VSNVRNIKTTQNGVLIQQFKCSFNRLSRCFIVDSIAFAFDGIFKILQVCRCCWLSLAHKFLQRVPSRIIHSLFIRKFSCNLSTSPSIFGVRTYNYCLFIFWEQHYKQSTGELSEYIIYIILSVRYQALFSDFTNDIIDIWM